VIGPATAEHLGVPHLQGARKLALARGGLVRVDLPSAIVMAQLPLLVTLAPVATRPRVRPAADKPKKRGKRIELLTLEGLQLRPEELRHRRGLAGELRLYAPELLQSGAALARRLRDEQLI
jgi:electron transfer flavoprotein alpha/beta subunit